MDRADSGVLGAWMNLPKPDNPGSEWLPTQPDRSYRRGMAQLRWRHFQRKAGAGSGSRPLPLGRSEPAVPAEAEPTRASRRHRPEPETLLAGSGRLRQSGTDSLFSAPVVVDRVDWRWRSKPVSGGRSIPAWRRWGIHGEVVQLSSRECLSRFSDGYGLLPGAALLSVVGVGARSVGSDLQQRLRSTLVKRAGRLSL